MVEQEKGQPSKEEIISAIKHQLESGGLLGQHEFDEQVEAIDWASREELERQKLFYQSKMVETEKHLSSDPKGPAVRQMERDGSRRIGHFERMISLLDQLIALTPEKENRSRR